MKNKKEKRVILFCGGGSGGHIFPGIAVIEHLRQDPRFAAFSYHWIGSCKPTEKKIVENHAVTFSPLRSGKLRRYLSPQNISDVFLTLLAIVRSVFILIKLKPLLLFAKGGFISLPVALAARLLSVPVFIHESDSTAGLANRMTAMIAERIFCGFASAVDTFPKKCHNRTVVSGNPVRPLFLIADRQAGKKIVERWIPQYNRNKPFLLVMSGSLGAGQIRDLLAESMQELLQVVNIVEQCGNRAEQHSQTGYHRRQFIGAELPHVMAAADIIVSRAGAGAISEIIATEKPAILLPLSVAGSRGEQLKNSEFMSESGAARQFLRSDAASFARLVIELAGNRDEREALGQGCRSLKLIQNNTLKLISDEIYRMVE